MSQRRSRSPALGLLLALALSPNALAEKQPDDDVGTLTFARVVDLARSRAPRVQIARTDVDASQGRLVGARSLMRENPTIEGLLGPRWTTGNRTTDFEVSLAIPIELGGKRSKRIEVAEAGLAGARHGLEDARRRTVGDALASYFRLLHGKERLALAQDRRALAENLFEITLERKRAGDVAQLEVNLAEGELSRAESAIASEEGNVARASAELAAVLGLPSGAALSVSGALGDRAPFDAIPASKTGALRPDIAAAEAELKESAAALRLANTARLPEVSFRVTYMTEEDADIVLGGAAITLPFFARAQGEQAEARTRRQRASIELQTRRNSASAEVEGARATYRAAVAAVQHLEDKAVTLAIKNEEMARESYRVGKIDLAALLLIRRDAIETRREYLDRLLDAALAGCDLVLAVDALPTPGGKP